MCDYQEKGCIIDKESKISNLAKELLFIIISKWENGKRSVHILEGLSGFTAKWRVSI